MLKWSDVYVMLFEGRWKFSLKNWGEAKILRPEKATFLVIFVTGELNFFFWNFEGRWKNSGKFRGEVNFFLIIMRGGENFSVFWKFSSTPRFPIKKVQPLSKLTFSPAPKVAYFFHHFEAQKNDMVGYKKIKCVSIIEPS